MKYIRFLFISLALFISCEKVDTTASTISIAHLKLMYGGYARNITENIVISGQVIADNSVNNLKGCVIIEDETGAIEIKVPYTYVAEYINVGNIVEVRCQGLCLGGYGGVVELGIPSEDPDYQTSSITAELLPEFVDIVEQGSSDNITIDEASIADLNSTMISTLVEIKNLRIVADSQTVWCNTIDENTNTLAVDPQGDTITLRTYGYCDFATELLPSSAIDAQGVVGYFYGYQLVLLGYKFAEN